MIRCLYSSLILGNFLKGGSWISTGDEASKFARFAFRRHFVQHAGFRIARSLEQAEKVNVPARLIKDDVFVLGVGVEGRDNIWIVTFLILKRTNDTEYSTQQEEATVDPLHVRFINSNLAITIYSLAYILQDNISCFQK